MEEPKKSETVQLRVRLTPEAYSALERLQEICGHTTIEETFQRALRAYMLLNAEEGEEDFPDLHVDEVDEPETLDDEPDVTTF